MSDSPIITMNIHGPIHKSRASEVTSALILEFGSEYVAAHDIAIYTGDADLSKKLAAAINSTIEAHAAEIAQRTSIQEAAE